MSEVTKKITVKKVRHSFLHKRPCVYQKEFENDDVVEDTPIIVDPRIEIMPRGEDLVLYPTLNLVESGRKVWSELGAQNMFQRVVSVSCQKLPMTRSITLNLELNANYHMKPWPYIVQRLESYGDLDLATWARKIRNYHESYRIGMEKYYNMFREGNSEIMENLRSARRKAVLFRQELEGSNTTFLKATLLAHRDGMLGNSVTYTEDFLREMGFTIESLAEWSKQHGILGITEKDCAQNVEFVSGFLSFIFTGFEFYFEIPEFVTTIVQADKKKKRVMMKVASIIEPVPEGIFIYAYYFVTKEAKRLNASQINNRTRAEEGVTLKSTKPVSTEVEEGKKMETDEN